MKITLNGDFIETDSSSLEELLNSLNYDAEKVATAINGEFVASVLRGDTKLCENDAIDVIAPMAGG